MYTQFNMQQQQSLPDGQFYFRWGRPLGAGGLGRVDEIIITASNADGLAVGDSLACKRLNQQWQNHPEARERFEREIRVLESLSHRNIVKVQGKNLPNGGERFYIMPLYPNGLRTRLAGRNSSGFNGFTWVNVASFAAVIADAMEYAHQMGFYHRDLKPENILLDENDTPVIADWGLGYFVHKNSKVLQHLTRGGMGTEYYCSMEQWNEGKCDATGDIYSLGMMVAELVTGQQVEMSLPGFAGTGIGIDVVRGNRQSEKAFNTLLREMTDLYPNKRVQSMQLVADRLRRLIILADAGR